MFIDTVSNEPPLYCGAGGAATKARSPMSRTSSARIPIATAAALLFVFAYIVGAVVLPGYLPAMPWPVEALYWCVAGLIWVLPVWWLMLWSVGKR